MKYLSKEDELKDALKEIDSDERRLKMLTCSWRIKGYKKNISRLKMKINKLKFQIGF